MKNILSKIITDSNYGIEQFSQDEIDEVEKLIFSKPNKKGEDVYYVKCQIRDKDIKLTDEELVRQLYINKLINTYSYPKAKMELESIVSFGREKKRADIVIFDKIATTSPYIIVELKKPKLKDGKEQLKSYCNATGAPIGVWTNGEQISFYHRKNPNFFEDIPDIPTFNDKLSDILSERWTIDDLIAKDKLITEKKSLKDLILEMEDEVLANAGVDVFEEVFKLIFTKLYDEMESGKNTCRHLEFRNYGDTESELKDKIQNLFDKAKYKWDGVFSEEAKISLSQSHLSVCVSSLQDVKLLNSNLEVVDDAFEYLMSKSSKGEKGQYFTPRYVIEMCVRMLNPKADETMIDTAGGSCGFPVHTIFYVWKQILKEKGIKQSHLFTSEEKPPECSDYVEKNVFAIDFDEKAVRVARTLNLIAGDGQTNVLHLNTLDYERWEDSTKSEDWIDVYNQGWKKLKRLRTSKNSDYSFNFDIIMANPPFAGDIKESRILAKYDLSQSVESKKVDNGDSTVVTEPDFVDLLKSSSKEIVYQLPDGTFRKKQLKRKNKVSRDILFVERNLNLLKPGGRMAIVLPQGRFNNSSDKEIREYVAEHCRILAVVGLHGNVFKPHTGTKTSVLFLQKWDEKICPKKEDYPIFFATMQEPSKDNSGDKIYVGEDYVTYLNKKYTLNEFKSKYESLEEANLYILKSKYEEYIKLCKKENLKSDFEDIFNNPEVIKFNEYKEKINKQEYILLHSPLQSREPLLDTHGHLIVKHDLFNHDGLTQDGIVEAFIEFAKKEKLSFF